MILRGSSLSGHTGWSEHRSPHPSWGDPQLPWSCWELPLCRLDCRRDQSAKEGEGSWDPESLRDKQGHLAKFDVWLLPTAWEVCWGDNTGEHQGLLYFHKRWSLWWNARPLIQA